MQGSLQNSIQSMCVLLEDVARDPEAQPSGRGAETSGPGCEVGPPPLELCMGPVAPEGRVAGLQKQRGGVLRPGCWPNAHICG